MSGSGDDKATPVKRGRPPAERPTAGDRLEALKLAHRHDRGPKEVLATATAYANFLASGAVPGGD